MMRDHQAKGTCSHTFGALDTVQVGFFFLRVGWKELEGGSSCVVIFFVEAQLLPVAYWQANMMNGCVAGVASTRVILIS